MKRIYYAGGSIVTGDDIASAVLEYAGALAKSPYADIVEIPVLDPVFAENAIATLLIGPASQVMCVPEAGEHSAEPYDADLLAELARRSAAILMPRRASSQSAPDIRAPGSSEIPDEFR